MKPFWTDPDGATSWYRIHILDKNYSVKVVDSPFEEDVTIVEVKQEWGGGKTASRQIHNGEEHDKVCAAFLAAKKAG